MEVIRSPAIVKSGKPNMTYCHTYLSGFCFSVYGLDPETPSEDYEIHLVRTADPAYLPPDSEAWPLYYQATIQALKAFPEAFQAARSAVSLVCEQIRGHRALPPHRLTRLCPP